MKNFYLFLTTCVACMLMLSVAQVSAQTVPDPNLAPNRAVGTPCSDPNDRAVNTANDLPSPAPEGVKVVWGFDPAGTGDFGVVTYDAIPPSFTATPEFNPCWATPEIVISPQLPDYPATIRLVCDSIYEFEGALIANSYLDSTVYAQVHLNNSASAPFSAVLDSVLIEYYKNGVWMDLASDFNASGILTSGNLNLLDTTKVNFRITNKGNTEIAFDFFIEINISDAETSAVLATETVGYTVLNQGAPTLEISPDWVSTLPCGDWFVDTLILTANCYEGTPVNLVVEIDDVNNLDFIEVEFLQPPGTWLPVPFPATGIVTLPFNLADAEAPLRIRNKGTALADTLVSAEVRIETATDTLSALTLATTVLGIPEVQITSDETMTCLGAPLQVIGTPNTGGSWTWTTSDETVATINEDGLLTPVGVGTPMVTYAFYDAISGCTNETYQEFIIVNPVLTLTSAAGTDDQTVVQFEDITEIEYTITGIFTDADVVFTGVANADVDWAIDGNIITINGAPQTPGLIEYTITISAGTNCQVEIVDSIYVCPAIAADAANEIDYNVAAVAGRCWYRENVRGSLYQDGTEIAPVPVVYDHNLNPNMPVDTNVFGLLYTYAAATNGVICPEGWSIPTPEEWASLFKIAAKDLKNNHWLTPNDNTNATGFDMPGAGFYNGATDRFEQLHGFTAFWSTAEPGAVPDISVKAPVFTYNCGFIEFKNIPLVNAISIRCIMDLEVEDVSR